MPAPLRGGAGPPFGGRAGPPFGGRPGPLPFGGGAASSPRGAAPTPRGVPSALRAARPLRHARRGAPGRAGAPGGRRMVDRLVSPRAPLRLGRQVLDQPHADALPIDRLAVHVRDGVAGVPLLLVLHEGHALAVRDLDPDDAPELAEGLLQGGLLRLLGHARHGDSALRLPWLPLLAAALRVASVRALAGAPADLRHPA